MTPQQRHDLICAELNKLTLEREGWMLRRGALAKKLNEDSRRDKQ